MVGLVIATHGRLAEELVATAEQIAGKLTGVQACNIEPGTSVEEIQRRMKLAVSGVDAGEGVIILADLFGGTPCNQSLSLCCQGRVEVVAGVNLPMLLKANSLRGDQMALSDMALALTQHGQKNITFASALLRGEPDRH